jgi:hypothetical protein
MASSMPTNLRRTFARGAFAGRAFALTLVVVIAGCSALSGRSPAPTPADFAGIAANLVRRGITVTRVVSGDAGCDDRTLARTAISFEASGADQPSPVKLHLFSFADQEAFDRLRPAIDACARSFVIDPETFSSIDASPFVLAGQGPWSPEFEARLRAGLQEAAHQGS